MPKKYTGLAAAGNQMVHLISENMFGHNDARNGKIQNAGAGQTG